ASPDGDFVVVWYGPNGENYAAIHARRFDASGTALGNEIQVETFGGIVPAVAVGATDYLGVWQTYVSAGNGPDAFSVRARGFDNAGRPQGPQFQVNTYTTAYQSAPALATDGAGNFVVVWQAEKGGGASDPKDSVQGQRLAFLPTTTSSTSTST